MATLRKHWLEVGWVIFAAANVAVMLVVPSAETIPFHLIWVSLTLVYGLRVWSKTATALTTVAICLVTGIALGRVVIGAPQGWDELTEVPLMAAMFVVMAMHAWRRQEAVEGMRRAAQRERDFVRDASHLLRTPITIARGHAELIAREDADGSIGADAEIVLEELDRLASISGRLLLLASAQNPYLKTFTHVDLSRLVDTVVDRWSPTAARAWKITTEPTTILGNQERLREALDALIENALRATAEGDEVAVSLRAEDDVVVLEVSDSGVGIATTDLDSIFERYSRGRSTRLDGMGLGLPIVKAIVEAHDGTVTATSDPGKSTTFRIRLPRLASSVDSQADPGVPTKHHGTNGDELPARPVASAGAAG